MKIREEEEVIEGRNRKDTGSLGDTFTNDDQTPTDREDGFTPDMRNNDSLAHLRVSVDDPETANKRRLVEFLMK